MSDAVAAKGTKLQYDKSGTWTTIGEIKSGPDGPNETVEKSDVTHHASPNDAMEHVLTLIDAGEISFGISYTQGKNEHDTLRTKKENMTRESWRILAPDESWALTFDADVTGLEMSWEPDAVIDADCTLDISGAVTEDTSPS